MSSVANAAILFEPDAYALDGPRLMGRQAAGNAFLRAAVAGRQGNPLWAYARSRELAEACAALVRTFDAAAETGWVPADRLDLVGQIGTLYLPGPGLGDAARLRLRAGPSAYSLCGVTHTTASHKAMDDITGLLTAPVMPWDAPVCTSSAVAGTVKRLLDSEIAALRWRFGPTLAVTLPLLPVIPLGVHCDDFAIAPPEREAARAALGIAADEVAALFFGRLSCHAKAHPHAMYAGLQAAAQRTGSKLVLIQCGWFATEAIRQAFGDGAARFGPDLRALFTNGRDPDRRRLSWAAADLFVSLSDNIQETFGLAPIEAMAAGLPVVVTDWDGYRDTVRDGVDGFRIPTWMMPPDGEPFARAYEAGIDTYDHYCGLTGQTVSVDQPADRAAGRADRQPRAPAADGRGGPPPGRRSVRLGGGVSAVPGPVGRDGPAPRGSAARPKAAGPAGGGTAGCGEPDGPVPQLCPLPDGADPEPNSGVPAARGERGSLRRAGWPSAVQLRRKGAAGAVTRRGAAGAAWASGTCGARPRGQRRGKFGGGGVGGFGAGQNGAGAASIAGRPTGCLNRGSPVCRPVPPWNGQPREAIAATLRHQARSRIADPLRCSLPPIRRCRPGRTHRNMGHLKDPA
jgi:glycosyltransferase involved in cell wall biosynthesis